MTIIDFMLQTRISNSHIDHPQFQTLYLRKTKRTLKIDGVVYTLERVIDIARIETREPGQGHFKSLIEYLTYSFPEYAIYLESVLNKRFQEYLVNNDFKSVGYNSYIYNWEQFS